jgi:hypothetical protein
MRQIIFILLTFFLVSVVQTHAQNLSIEGKVVDRLDGTVLSFANIRVLGSMRATSSNDVGEFRIYLHAGKYTLVASYLGYNSDTVSVDLTGKNGIINFSLNRSTIAFPTVVVTPGINPALAIVKEAIVKKEKRAEKINSYEMDSYTKGIFKSNQEEDDEPDSAKHAVKIVGILENTGVSYFKKPDYYKDVIIARKQTANFPPEINTMIGSKMIQSFYENKINFFDLPIPGPIANNALSYYDYYIVDSLAIDNQKVYKIHVNTLSDSDPGFTGSIFIMDKSFDLIKVDVELNRAANLGGFLDTVKIFQQFLQYDSLYMPVDYRIAVKLNLLGLIKLSVDLNSVMYNYKINTDEKEELFNKAIVTVLPDADSRDSEYWNASQFIPNNDEEKKAYFKIDSMETAPKSLGKRLLNSLMEGEYSLNKNFYITTPLNMYHFNRVEGHAIDFGVAEKDLFAKRLNSQLKFHYGFSDKKFKTEFETSMLLGDYRTYKISFSAFQSIVPLLSQTGMGENPRLQAKTLVN